MSSDVGLGTAQSLLFKIAAIGTIFANYGRVQLEGEIKTNLEASAGPKHEAKENWLGYQANAWTALYGFRQGYFYYSAMGIFYYHLSKRKGKLHWLEIAGIVNQVVFHVHSIFEFHGLSQQVSAVFAALVGGGALANYFANVN